MQSLAHYSPEDVIILVAGIPITGLAEGTFVNIQKAESLFNTKVTADGVVSRSKNTNPIYTVRLTLHSGSPFNDLLSKLYYLDEVTQRAQVPLLIKDSLGSSLFFTKSAWVSELPVMQFADEMTDRDWTFSCVQSSVNFGGNEEASSILEDLLNTSLGAIPSISRMF